MKCSCGTINNDVRTKCNNCAKPLPVDNNQVGYDFWPEPPENGEK